MSESPTLLPPLEQSAPRRAHIPYKRALRWRAPDENSGQSQRAIEVFVSQEAYAGFCTHSASDMENEVGGWLVGKWRADWETGQQFIVVEATLPARHTRQGSAFLTFTQDSQVALYADFQERFPNKELVGWYHTHPRMGVFLSSHDTWLHRNFFTHPYQVALVIEPYSYTGGFFIRTEDGDLDPNRYHGFYELKDARKRSVVHWQNLILEAESYPEKGDLP